MNVRKNRKIVKWGTSAGMRIPYQALAEADMKVGDTVFFDVYKGEIMLISAEKKDQTEENLLNQIEIYSQRLEESVSMLKKLREKKREV